MAGRVASKPSRPWTLGAPGNPILLFGIEEGEDNRGVEDQRLPVLTLVHGPQRRNTKGSPTGTRSPTARSSSSCLLFFFFLSSNF
jgi:hypothetical protein